MATVLLDGHAEAGGAKALLELFYGPASAISNEVNGQQLEGFLSGTPEPCFISTVRPECVAIEMPTGDILISEPVASDLKRQIKRQLYRVLAEASGLNWPWGSLTGIRPTYVAGELLLSFSPEEAYRRLTEDYAVSPGKAALALRTAEAEEAICARLDPGAYAVYVGVPFCPTRCSYCSFTTEEGIGTAETLGDRYLDSLELEIQDFLKWRERPGQDLVAVYVGGGTPAALTEEQFARLLKLIKTLPAATNCEWTVEAGRADVLTEAKLAALNSAGIKRICLNPQTMHDSTLARVNRRGTSRQFRETFHLARAHGMTMIQTDLIAGLRGEGWQELRLSLEDVISLEPDAITLHTLARKRGSAHSDQVRSGRDTWRNLPDPELEEAIAEAQRLLESEGYSPYYLYRQHYALGGLENVSFARAGKHTQYNVMMMSDRYPIVSFGCPAISKQIQGRKSLRLAAPKSLRGYLDISAPFLERKRVLFTKP